MGEGAHTVLKALRIEVLCTVTHTFPLLMFAKENFYLTQIKK